MASESGKPPASGRDGRSPFSSKGFVASAVFLVVVVLLGGWVISGHLVDRGARPTSASAVPSAEESETASGVPGGGGSECGLEAGDQQVPSSAPQGQVEFLAPGVGIPVLEGLGPGRLDGISRCFAHSPTGAVLASVNWMKWFSSKQRLSEVITTLMSAGPDRDRLARQVDDGWDGSTGQGAQVHGFKVDVRSADEVVVTLAVSLDQGGDEGLVSWPVLLRWEEGDWKVVAPQTESWGQEPVASVAAGGFTPWRV